MKLSDKLQNQKIIFENYLFDLIDMKELSSSVLKDSMMYSLKRGGKRIRPLLSFATASIKGYKDVEVYPFASSLELIHNYSLVHDDLPSMDNDDFRRGLKTTHIIYGDNYALLAGDALLSLAVENSYRDLILKNTENKINAYNCLFEMSGSTGMIDGQAFEIDHDIAKNREEIIYKKTGMLFVASIVGTGYYLGYPENLLDLLEKFSVIFGKSFQLMDDIADGDGSVKTYIDKGILLNDLKQNYYYLNVLLNQISVYGDAESLKYIVDEIFNKEYINGKA